MSGSEVGRAASAIRDMIEAGRFLPGEELWPAQVAALLGVEHRALRGVEPRVVVAALRELGRAGITRGNTGSSGGYWFPSRRRPRFRGLALVLGRWLWSDDAGRTFVGTTPAGGVVAALADEEGNVGGQG